MTQKNLSLHANSFFPERNHIQFEPIEGRNFTEETLHYICPQKIAHRITEGLIKRLPFERRFLLIELGGGIGGNTCNFLCNKYVGLVISYEKDMDRSLMLKRNISSYNLGKKCIVINEEFIGADLASASGCVIYSDPPWLPNNITGNHYSKNDYILSGLIIGEKTLEEWLDSYRDSVYMIVYRLPPNYELSAVSGWRYDVDDLTTQNGNKGRVYYCINTNQKVKDSYLANDGGLKPYLNLLEYPESFGSSCPLVAYSFKDIAPINILQELLSDDIGPISKNSETVSHISVAQATLRNLLSASKKYNHAPSLVPIDKELINRLPTPSENIEPGSEQWISEFQKYIYELLTLVNIKPEIRLKMVDNNAMPTWIRAWTHETWNSNVDQNYENIETIGDSVVGYAFKIYLFERFGKEKITSAGISEYKAQYMSKMHQSPIARDLKMGSWVLAQINANVNILEDLFESFCGALHEVGDSIKKGLGAVFVRNMISTLFKNVEFDPSMILGTAKTVITQYSHRLHWDKIKEESFGAGANMTVTVSLSDAGFNDLRQHGLTPPVPLGKGHGLSEKAASDAAYRDALKNLNTIGVTHDWVIKMRSKISFSSLDPELVAKVQTKATRNGFTIKIVTPRSTATVHSVIVQLIGILSNGKETILATATAQNEEEGKLRVFQQYANSL